MKRILTVQDFSCVGKCSLTVALPIVSAFGLETCSLPTALLSTHTAFKHWSFANLCSQIPPITKAWRDENITFDGFYSGYLGGKDLIESVKNIIDEFCKSSLVLIDPAMGDNGKLYAGFDLEYAQATKTLCAKADIISPNITEACFMLGEEYKAEYDADYLHSLCARLYENGAKNIVITGVKKQGKVGVYCLLGGKEVYEYYTDREKQDFHGTGDVYSSTLFGSLMRGKDIKESARFACDFTKNCIAKTLQEENHINYGVNFEYCISDICDFIK